MTTFLIGAIWTLGATAIGFLAGRLWVGHKLAKLEFISQGKSGVIAQLHTEVAALIAEKNRRMAPLIAANAKRRADAVERKGMA